MDEVARSPETAGAAFCDTLLVGGDILGGGYQWKQERGGNNFFFFLVAGGPNTNFTGSGEKTVLLQ